MHSENPITSSTGHDSVPPLVRCDQCNSWERENARNLVVCIDGTSNEFGQNHTNVVKLFSKIDVKTTYPEQLTYYIGGIGTDPKSSHILSRAGRSVFDKLDMAVGWNVDKIIKEAYRWLAGIYQAGDRIYLFGFSRGAYQARVLAAMIYEVGLTTTPMEKQINRAYARYRAIYSGKSVARDTARAFKKLFSYECLRRVHFVGVWDTVSSVGFIKGKTFLSGSLSASHACHFRHALALDELRVKFVPEYFLEINSQTGLGKSNYVKYTADTEYSTPHVSERSQSTMSEDRTWESKNDIEEVWFAGCHSDVGGVDRSGSYNAGNVSLLWMRREAAANGLVLQPTDRVWVPGDLDFGVSDSMTSTWQVMEYVPITHQVSFSGAGDHSRRLHRLQPRRIIPGQKVHASVLYANKYKPRASLGEGFDKSIVHTGLDTELVSWETGLFDDTAAKDLVDHLGRKQGISPINVDRLLFMLRFEEGKQCIRNVPEWDEKFGKVINSHDCAPFTRLVALVAYHETFLDPDVSLMGPELPYIEPSRGAFDVLKQSLSKMAASNDQEGRRVVALLRFLTKHEILRENVLTDDVLDTLMTLFDTMINLTGRNFIQAMDGLTCLLQCENTQKNIINDFSRISPILDVKEPHLLTAALHMMTTLVQIPGARRMCEVMMPKLRELAEEDTRLVGLLSVEILLSLCSQDDLQGQLDISNANVRANLAGALVRLGPGRYNSALGKGSGTDVGPTELSHPFHFRAGKCSDWLRGLIEGLMMAVQKGNAGDRTVATFGLLKLCEIEISTPAFLRETGLLDVFIGQLRRKDTALLAAHALGTCLKHDDMKEYIKGNELFMKNIVDMLRLDYFDDAVGQVEGFQIFGKLMQYRDLRKKIKDYNIIEVLNTKLIKGKPKETRTGLICLDILCAFSDDGLLHREFFATSLDCLRSPARKAQKAGVAILCALARTERGVATIRPRIPDIVEMLLPGKDFPAMPGTNEKRATLFSDTEQTPMNQEVVDSWLPRSHMMGPARALHALAQNERLRETTRDTQEYSALKYLYLSGVFMDKTNRSLWRGNTLNHAVIDVLGKMIKAIDADES